MRSLCLMLALCAQTAEGACRQALALGLDISGSVDAREYRLQLNGLADALTRPDVQQAILAMPGAPVDLTIYEWSGPAAQTLLQPWITLRDPEDISDVAQNLRATQRRSADPSTAIGAAQVFGRALLDQRPTCWRHVLDLSGDGRSNTGPRPRRVRDSGALHGMTINALVIGADNPASGDARQVEIGELTSYFRAEVIFGDAAFVETALGFEDYADAMERKLLRELQVVVIGAAAPDTASRSKLSSKLNRYSGSDPSNTAPPGAGSH